MFEHFLELVRVGVEDFHVNFADTVLQYLAQDFRFFRAEFDVLHTSSSAGCLLCLAQVSASVTPAPNFNIPLRPVFR
jgi:hypothetical protein